MQYVTTEIVSDEELNAARRNQNRIWPNNVVFEGGGMWDGNGTASAVEQWPPPHVVNDPKFQEALAEMKRALITGHIS